MTRASRKLSGPPYGVHPGIITMQRWVETLKEKTGRSLDEWLALIRREGPAEEKERRQWLKAEHGLGTNSAWWLAERAAGKGTEDGDPDAYLRAAPGLVDALYSGPRAGLRPIHDRLVELAAGLGADVRLCPCQTIVPLYRRHVFAEIKPATRTRIDLGFALGDVRPTGWLIDTGGTAKKDRITHRIPLTRLDEIDAEVQRWLKAAYDRDA
jgi:hypothetical protein